MKHTRLYLYAIGALFLSMPLYAQLQQGDIYDNQILVKQNTVMEQVGDSVKIDLTLDLSRLEISSGRSLTLTPVLVGTDSVRMLPVLLNGRNRHKVYRRNVSLGLEDPQGYYTVVKMTGDAEKTVRYQETLPYVAWMQGANLQMEEDLCGCGGHTEVITRDPLFAFSAPAAVPVIVKEEKESFQPAFCYVRPLPEKLKTRTELKDIYLNFPVNKVVIYPDYMNNQAELGKAQEMIERINSDKNLSIQEVVVRGYASPEGSVPSNFRLSEGRAAALKNYLLPRLHNASLPMRSESGGEDWEGVIELLQTAPVAGSEELLTAIRKGDRSDAAEMALRTLDGGKPYAEMLREIYPKVRRVLCSVRYTAREFTVEESRAIIGRNPEQLSAYEIFLVAETYPEDAKEYKEAIYTAARLYPSDENALVNAANVALSENDLTGAEKYLEKVHTTNVAYENACGVLATYRADYAKAAKHFRQAAEAGSEAGRHNLSELERVYANKLNNE